MSAAMSGMYKLMLLLHIVSIVAAFAPAVANPLILAKAKPDGLVAKLGGYMASNDKRVHFPALVLVGVFGLAMVFSSKPDGVDENLWGFDQAWVSLALLNWIALCGVVSGMITPAEKRLAAGDADAEKKVTMGGQIVTVLFLVMLYLMIWKPGA